LAGRRGGVLKGVSVDLGFGGQGDIKRLILNKTLMKREM